jgi:hypothetical protein
LEDEIMVVRLSGTQPQGPKHLETLENKTVDGTQNTVRVNRGATVNRPAFPVVGEFYYNTDKQAFEQYTSAGWFNIAQAPSAPTSVVATDQGSGRSYNDGQASVAFTPNSSGGAPSSFIVTPSPATSPTTFTTTSSPATVTGLSSSTQYTYTVSATGTYGTSAASAASAGVTATTVPQAPTVVASADTATTASIAITAGATGGSAITQYTIISNPTTTTQTTSSSPYIFTGLTTGSAYTFSATATNSNGLSLSSSASNSIVVSEPSVLAYESIASTRLSSPQAAVTFSSIPQGFKHLQVRWTGGCGDDYIYLTTNLGNSGGAGRITNYGNTWYNGGGTVSGGQDATYGHELHFGGIGGANPAAGVIDILDYSSTTKGKIALSRLARTFYPDNQYSVNNITFFNLGNGATGAINSVTLQAKAAYPLVAGTTVSLYGIKG